MSILYNYDGNVVDDLKSSIAKMGKNGRCFIKRTRFGFFYNENNTKHGMACKLNDTHPYEFVKVCPEVFNLYIKFLQTKNDLYIRKAERLYNES